MFGFNVITWNSGPDKGSYKASLDNILFGGSSGHAAAELVIPATEKNRQLIQEVNTKNKLWVKEETTLVSRRIDEPPGYVADKVPCFRIYFSFWGDAKTKITPEKHRMMDETRDRLEENKGIPVQYSNKARKIFGENDSHFDEIERRGRLGKRKGKRGLNTIFHQTNQGDEAIQQSSLLLERLEEIEKEKDLVLFRVKSISYKLSKLKTDEEKQAYLDGEDAQNIFQGYEVENYLELEQKLLVLSAELTEVRSQLETLGMRFGANPDNIIFFPINEKCNSSFMLDYRAMLIEMAFTANNPVPYNIVRMNCSSTVIGIIKAGLNKKLRGALSEAGFSIPSSNVFFETPQSAHKFAQQLSDVLLRAELETVSPEPKADRFFWTQIQQIFLSIINYIFAEKPEKLIQKSPSPDVERQMLINDLELLDKMHEDGQISEESHTKMKETLELKIQNLPQEARMALMK